MNKLYWQDMCYRYGAVKRKKREFGQINKGQIIKDLFARPEVSHSFHKMWLCTKDIFKQMQQIQGHILAIVWLLCETD